MLAEYLSKFKASISLGVILFFSFFNLFYQADIFARSANNAVRVLDFFSNSIHTFGDGVVRIVDSYGNYNVLRRERDALRAELQNAKDLQLQIAQLKEENRKLRDFLTLPEPVDYPIIVAEVISIDPDNWFRTIIVNKGEEDGIHPYMPVISYQIQKYTDDNGVEQEKVIYGVVGKVIQVTDKYSRILPVTDQYSRIGVRLKKNGYWGMLSGQSQQGGLPKLEYINLDANLEMGDEIVTSGSGGIFPRNLPVGYVTENVVRGATFQEARIKTSIDVHRIDTVMIIKKLPERPQKVFSKESIMNIEESAEDAIEKKEEREKANEKDRSKVPFFKRLFGG